MHQATNGDNLKIILSGDTLMTSAYDAADKAHQSFINLLRQADVRVTNLEIPLNGFMGSPLPNVGIHLSGAPEIGESLLSLGFNLFAGANNHALDYGVEGLRRHIDIMKKLDMNYTGVGEDLARASRPAYLETEQGCVALVSCTSSLGGGWPAVVPNEGVFGRPGVNALRFETTYVLEQHQFAQLQEIVGQLSMSFVRSAEFAMGYKPYRIDELPPAEPSQLTLFDRTIRAGSSTGMRTTLHAGDLERNLDSIREARKQAKLVIVSLHAHEFDTRPEEPAQFIIDFAHQCIDAGAHIVMGSGPHLLRGIEIYKGRPIFYSLGNLWFQYETLEYLPPDTYEYYGLPVDSSPSDFADHALLDFQKDSRYWETLIPVCEFERGRLKCISLHPVTLGYGQPRAKRGQPRLANSKASQKILAGIQALSRPFNTIIREQGGVGHVVL
jgi:poly-gamma-glutamate synthesis protein (capsule biosynthesis protein)